MSKHFKAAEKRQTPYERFMALGRYYDKEFERSGLDDKIKENKLSNAELSQSDKEKLFYLKMINNILQK